MRKHKARFGYCGMTCDYLHIGHINFLKQCKDMCRYLIVGVMTDKAIGVYKKRKPAMSFEDRKILMENIRLVDKVYGQDSFEFPRCVVVMKLFWDKDFIIFDSEEHGREHSDILIPRTPYISSSKIRSIDENIDTSQCSI